MIKCEICQKEFKKFVGLGNHVRTHGFTSKDYYDKYLKKDGEGICQNENCNNATKYYTMEKGYFGYCSYKCLNSSKEVQDKKRKTCLTNYGVESPLQSKKIKEKFEKTCSKKHGVKNPFQSEKIRKKCRQTFLKKYGVDNPSKLKEFQEKQEQTCLKNHGVKHPSQSKQIREKQEQTCLKNHGVKNPSQSKQIREKQEQTCFKNHGVNNPMRNKEIQELCHNSRRITFYNNLINSTRLKELVTPNFILKEYTDCTDKSLSWICLKCQTIFEDNLINGKIPRCPTCYPIKEGTSRSEQEIWEFIKSLNIKVSKHDHSILNRKELDILIPSHNLAIELNGLYWHSELGGNTPPNYHLNKMLECQEKGIQLIHIFEDEWIEKRSIVESIIKSKLNLITNKIPARKCIIQKVDKKQAFNFLNNNHLQDYIDGNHLGLFFNGILVSILTYGTPRFNTNYETEIYRFCNKNDLIVQGGLSRLISHINAKSILTYVDRRYGNGKSYLKVGFRLINISTPNYFYMKNYSKRESRLNYQKHKLKDKMKIFDENLTEWQNMQLNGYDRIWDCGNYCFISTK